MPSWIYSIYPQVHAPGLEFTQGLGVNIRDYVVEKREEDSGWTTVKHVSKLRKGRRV